jgi:hypothetical protein
VNVPIQLTARVADQSGVHNLGTSFVVCKAEP